jgi:hypothetical protein
MAELSKPLPDEHRAVKRVFEPVEPMAETDLDIGQIWTVSVKKVAVRALNVPLGSQHLKDFMVLQLSRERKSRAEFVESLKNKKAEIMEKARGLALFG